MCSKVQCRNCGKITWSGCGEHVEYALRGVTEQDLCKCDESSPQTFFSKLFSK